MNQLPKSLSDMVNSARAVNEALKPYADKDWNYSRITLQVRPLNEIKSPYVLWIEFIEPKTKEGERAVKACANEVTWGSRHSSELGMLEIVSLRLNKALLEATTDSHWPDGRPIIRLTKVEELELKGINSGFWYEIREVRGEDFDER